MKNGWGEMKKTQAGNGKRPRQRMKNGWEEMKKARQGMKKAQAKNEKWLGRYEKG